MGRPIRPSTPRRRGRCWETSALEQRGAKQRVWAYFATEADARRWSEAAAAALTAGGQPPTPDRYGGARKASEVVIPATPAAQAPDRSDAATAPKPAATELRSYADNVAALAAEVEEWIVERYEIQRQGGPGRERQVRDSFVRIVIPFLAFRIGSFHDLERPVALELSQYLAGQLPLLGGTTRTVAAHVAVDVSDAAELTGRTEAELRGQIRDGELRAGLVCGKVAIAPAALLDGGHLEDAPVRGYSRAMQQEILANVSTFTGWLVALGRLATDPMVGIVAIEPDEAARIRPKRTRTGPLALDHAATLARHLHIVHQLTMWLMRLCGLRISETFGILVGDVLDLGRSMAISIQRQGGRAFLTRDEHGNVETRTSVHRTKTGQSVRVIVVPEPVAELVRVVIRAFHTDPATGEVDLAARLLPGAKDPNASGQAAYRSAFAAAIASAGLDDADVECTAHDLRAALLTDLAWTDDLDELARKRYAGHRAGDDVHHRHYIMDDPTLAPMRKVATAIEEMISDELGTLHIPTTKRFVPWTGSPLRERTPHIEATLIDAGLLAIDTEWLDAHAAADLLDYGVTQVRRWMADGTLPAKQNDAGVRVTHIDDLHRIQDQLACRRGFDGLAKELDVSYDWAYKTVHRLGLDYETTPDGRHAILSDGLIDRVRVEKERLAALAVRSVRVAEAATRLGVAVSTVHRLVKGGELVLDPERDAEGAKHITRSSLDALEARRRRRGRPAGVSRATVCSVTGFTDQGLDAALDAGLLSTDGDTITRSSLEAWAAGYRPDLLAAIRTHT